MPNITLMPSGINAAFAGRNSAPVSRGTVNGLTQGSARRCKAFLMSIDTSKLTGIPITFTLTLKDCPASAKDWNKLKDEFFKRLRKMGLIRLHYVTEWTKRSIPHLHGMGFFEPFYTRSENICGTWTKFNCPISQYYIEDVWCDVAAGYGALLQGQDSRQEKGSVNVAWFKYMSKHASRSASHYQREKKSIPKAWEVTGKMWGKIGKDWPTHSERHEVEGWAFHHLRRQVRRLRRSQAVTEIRKGKAFGNDRQARGGLATLRYLRSLKRVVDPARSSRLPISEWVSAEVATLLLEGIHFNIEPRPDRDYTALRSAHPAPKQEPGGLAQRALAAAGQGRPIKGSVWTSQDGTASSASAAEPQAHQSPSCSSEGRTERRSLKSLIYGIK